MSYQETITLSFNMPLYLHEEISFRAKSAQRCKENELVARLQDSFLAYPVGSVDLKEAEKLKLFLSSKYFSKQGRIILSAELHQQLKKASIKAGQSMGLELSCRIHKSVRDDSHNYIN